MAIIPVKSLLTKSLLNSIKDNTLYDVWEHVNVIHLNWRPYELPLILDTSSKNKNKNGHIGTVDRQSLQDTCAWVIQTHQSIGYIQAYMTSVYFWLKRWRHYSGNIYIKSLYINVHEWIHPYFNISVNINCAHIINDCMGWKRTKNESCTWK